MGKQNKFSSRGDFSDDDRDKQIKPSQVTGDRGKRRADKKPDNFDALKDVIVAPPPGDQNAPVGDKRKLGDPDLDTVNKLLPPDAFNNKPDTELERLNDLDKILKEEKPTKRQLRLIYEAHQEEGSDFFSDENKIKQALVDVKAKAEKDLADDRQDIMKRFKQLVVREKGRKGQNITNLDSHACLFFFRKILKFERLDATQEEKDFLARTQYIKLGEDEKMSRGIFLDISPGIHGSQVRGEGKDYDDHHGPESPRHSSAFQGLVDGFYKAGLLDYLNKDEGLALDEMAEFVSHVDCYTLPKGENWKKTWNRKDLTLFDVSLLNQDDVSVDDLYECFKAQPNQKAAFQWDISHSKEPYLSSFKALIQKTKEKKNQAESFLKEVDKERRDFKGKTDAPHYNIIESPTLGKLVVHFQERPEERTPALQFAALGHGYDGVVNYQPGNHTFLLSVSSEKEITKEMAEKIPEAVLVRGGMLLSSKKEKKETKLADLLQAMGVDVSKLNAEGRLKKFLEEEKTGKKPKISPAPVDVAAFPTPAVEPEPVKDLTPTPPAPPETPPAPSTPEIPVVPTSSEMPQPSTETAAPAGPEMPSTPATAEAPRAVETVTAPAEPELKQAMAEAKAAFEATKKNWEKYQGLLGLFRRGQTEEKAQITNEYEAAKDKYARAKAEYVFFKAGNFLTDQSKMVDGYAQIIARTLERKRGGKAREWLNKIYTLYKKSGDLNIARAFKFEEKLAKWQPETKKGKFVKFLANLGGRYLSLRTGVSLLLLGGAVGAGAGVTFAALMGIRRTLAGLGGFVGTNEVWKGIERTKLLKEIPKDKLAKMTNEDLIERMRQIEVYNLLEGKEDFSGFGYDQLKDELNNRLENERITPASAETPAGTESSAERESGERGQAVEKKLESLLANVDKQLEGVEAKFKKSQIKRLLTSTAVAGLLGSGLFGEIIGRTWHGLFGSESGMSEPIEALAKKSVRAMEEFQQKINLFAKIAVNQDTQVNRTAQLLGALQEFKNQAATALRDNIEKIHLAEIRTVGGDEGVENALKRLLLDNPVGRGFKGDLADKATLSHWADREADLIARENNYVRPDGSEVRIAKPGVKVYLDSNNKIRIVGEGKTTYIESGKMPKGLSLEEKQTWASQHSRLSWDENWEGKKIIGSEYWRQNLEKLAVKYPNDYAADGLKVPSSGAGLEEVQKAYGDWFNYRVEHGLPQPEELTGPEILAREAAAAPQSAPARAAEMVPTAAPPAEAIKVPVMPDYWQGNLYEPRTVQIEGGNYYLQGGMDNRGNLRELIFDAQGKRVGFLGADNQFHLHSPKEGWLRNSPEHINVPKPAVELPPELPGDVPAEVKLVDGTIKFVTEDGVMKAEISGYEDLLRDYHGDLNYHHVLWFNDKFDPYTDAGTKNQNLWRTILPGRLAKMEVMTHALTSGKVALESPAAKLLHQTIQLTLRNISRLAGRNPQEIFSQDVIDEFLK